LLDEPAVARTSFISGNNTVVRRLLASAAGESEGDGHDLDSLSARREPAGESDYNAGNCQGEAASFEYLRFFRFRIAEGGMHYERTAFDIRDNIWEFSTSMYGRICLLFLAATALAPSAAWAEPGRPQPAERRAVVFYIAETHGTLEPCGCTSDPLGDFARVTALVRKAAGGKKAAMLVDAGGLLFPAGEISPARQAAARLRARFLADQIVKLPFGGIALGPSDLALGTDGVKPKRLAANLASAPSATFVEPSRVVDVGRIKMGVVGVADVETTSKAGLAAQDPAEAARAEVARVRASGAEVVILLAPLERPLARTLARTVGADFVIAGKNVGAGMARAESVGPAFLLAPAGSCSESASWRSFCVDPVHAKPMIGFSTQAARSRPRSAWPSWIERSRSWTTTSQAGRRIAIRMPPSWRARATSAASFAKSAESSATVAGSRPPVARIS
jgi:hypothetical protein